MMQLFRAPRSSLRSGPGQVNELVSVDPGSILVQAEVPFQFLGTLDCFFGGMGRLVRHTDGIGERDQRYRISLCSVISCVFLAKPTVLIGDEGANRRFIRDIHTSVRPGLAW